MTGTRREYVEAFLECLAPGDAANHCFQAIHDTEENTVSGFMFGSFAQHEAKLKTYSDMGYGIFWTVNRTNGTGRLKEDIVAVRAVWLDIDEQGRDIPPIVAALTPHCVVESSPGKHHLYWRVTCTLADFDPLLYALTDAWRGDKGAKGINRVLRLPGFNHQKGAPFLSRIAQWNP